MERTERLKEVYKRNNETEDKILCTIIDAYPTLTIVRGKDVPDIDWCKKNINNITLVIDAKSPNLTELGNNRIVEFCLIYNKKPIWIDAKHLSKRTNISDILYGEIERAKNYKGSAMFVCDGNGYTPKAINEFVDYLKKNNYPQTKVVRIEDFINNIL